MQKFFSLLILAVGLFSYPLSAQNCPNPANPKILIVGDSWSYIMHKEKFISNQLNRLGYGDWKEKGDKTALAGSTAAMWTEPVFADLVRTEIQSNPTIEVVVLVIGGNDILAGKIRNGWTTSLTSQEETALMDRIEGQIRSIITNMKNANSQIKVLICGYDYINFVSSIFNPETWLTWDNLGQPTPRQINDAIIKLEQRKINIANGDPSVFYVHNLGLMHRKYGYEKFFGANISPIPGNNPPNYAPFPGGFPDFPSSKKALGADGSDPIHFNNAGYTEITKNLINHFFIPYIKGKAQFTGTSEGKTIDGFVKPSAKNNNQFRIGRDAGGFYRNIVSFNTSPLPDDAIVQSASIYLTRSGATFIKFPKAFDKLMMFLDVKTGFFGNSNALETADYSAASTMSNVGCFVGTVASNGAKLRIDVTSSGLPSINKTGTTQFRFYMDDKVTGTVYYSFFDGDAVVANRPVLEISYTTGANKEIQTLRISTDSKNVLPENNSFESKKASTKNYSKELHFISTENATLTVSDASGYEILKTNIAKGSNQIPFAKPLKPGSYIIRVEGKTVTRNIPYTVGK